MPLIFTLLLLFLLALVVKMYRIFLPKPWQ